MKEQHMITQLRIFEHDLSLRVSCVRCWWSQGRISLQNYTMFPKLLLVYIDNSNTSRVTRVKGGGCLQPEPLREGQHLITHRVFLQWPLMGAQSRRAMQDRPEWSLTYHRCRWPRFTVSYWVVWLQEMETVLPFTKETASSVCWSFQDFSSS